MSGGVAAGGTDRWGRRGRRRANAALGVVHLAQAALVLLLANGFAIPVTAAFQEGPPGSAPGDRTKVFDAPFGPLVALFLALAAVDHLLMASPRVINWYERNLARGRNDARWTEYSVSASVMIGLILLLTGITDLFALLGLVAANVAMIMFGALMERSNPDRRNVRWAPFAFGCFAGAIPWIAIAIAIGGSAAGAGDVPGFVYGIFVSLFLLFNCFAVNQALQFRRVGPWREERFSEMVYIWLSLVAKSALAWQVFAGALAV